QLPIGSTYTGSNSSSMGGTIPAAVDPAASNPAVPAPAAVRAPAVRSAQATYGPSEPVTYSPSEPVTYSPSEPVTYGRSAPVTYGRSAPIVVCRPLAPTNSSAIAGFVISLISFVSSFFFLGFIGIVFGHVARSQIKRRGERGNGMAVAALWLGYLGVIFWILFWLAYFGVIALMVGLAVAADTGTIS